jgi:hypothetical protein
VEVAAVNMDERKIDFNLADHSKVEDKRRKTRKRKKKASSAEA